MVQPKEVDVIVCGGGPAGCVVAGRLAYADPNLQVMLIEGGNNNRDDPWVYRPGIYQRNMQRDGINDKATFYTDTMQSSYLRGRQSIVPCANILGGGSSINFQMYTRASASDWDDFKTEGWTAKDLVPLMKRLENYQKPCNNDTHGYDGPIAISNGGQITALAWDFIRASDALGIPFSDDIQDLDTAHASEIWAKYINRHTGRRSDAATAYVHSVMDVQSNLHLRTNSRVSRVIFEGTKAVGVAYVHSRNRAHKGELLETIVRARKCVVLSSGTLGTPQILERSGVGNAKLLKSLDIKVVSDLPGVGEEYQDHYTTLSIFRVSNESQTTDDFLRGHKETQDRLFAQWETSPEKAFLSSNAIDAGFKIRPTEEELKEMGPEFNELWDRYFKDKPDKPVMFASVVSGAYADHTLLPPGKYMTMFQYLVRTTGFSFTVGRIDYFLGISSQPWQDPHSIAEPVQGAVLRFRVHEQQGRLRADSLELQEDSRGCTPHGRIPWRTHFSPSTLPPGVTRCGEGHRHQDREAADAGRPDSRHSHGHLAQAVGAVRCQQGARGRQVHCRGRQGYR
jgi:alcohol oxidase